MATIGYHASHEQHPPGRLLRDAQYAAEAGFGAVSCSDHITPWSRDQGESGFAWSWLGAAMATTSVPFGVVNAPGQRYHPAIIAQAIATLGEMFPGRLTVALGSGEASNEHITGDAWPDKAIRNARLRECVDVIRALLQGDEVTTHGLVRVDQAKLWTLPGEAVPLIGAALSTQTAAWCGDWADGLITVHRAPDKLAAVIDAFRQHGGGDKPVVVQVKVAYAGSDDEALAGAYEQWRTNVFDSSLMADLERVEQFEVAATHVRPEDMRASVLVSSDLGRHAAWLAEARDAGADDLFLHHVPRPQREFVDAFASKVLPELSR
jgi:probable non-F420 flavinoid oxidoreductase